MHLGMPECHKLFLGHCDLDLWPSFQELLCPEHICYIIWCRNPKFGVVISLGMAEWCIPFWGTLTLALTSGLISRFFVLYYSYLSSNVSYARPIPLGAFVTCMWHFLFAPVICLVQLNSPAVVSPRIIFQWPLPYVKVFGPNYLEVCGAVELQQGRNQLSSSVYANKTLQHGSGNQHIWTHSVDSNREPEYAKRTPLVDFFCKGVTIFASG